MRTRPHITRYRRLTRTEAECHPYNSCTYFTIPHPPPHPSSILSYPPSPPLRSSSAQCASTALVPPAPATASLSHSIRPPNTSSLPSQSKQALNSLSHHYQEQEPPACAILPSPAAFDHTSTTTQTHRRSLSPVLTRFTAQRKSASPGSAARHSPVTGRPRDE